MNDEKHLGPEMPEADERSEQIIKSMLYATIALPFILGALILLLTNP